MISNIVNTITSNPYIMPAVYLIIGWQLHRLYRYKISSKSIGRSKVELVNTIIAHQIVAKTALSLLDEEEKKILEDIVNGKLDDSMMSDADLNIK